MSFRRPRQQKKRSQWTSRTGIRRVRVLKYCNGLGEGGVVMVTQRNVIVLLVIVLLLTCVSGAKRIACVGDSSTFDMGVDR